MVLAQCGRQSVGSVPQVPVPRWDGRSVFLLQRHPFMSESTSANKDNALADLGYGVLGMAMVETAAYVLEETGGERS